MKCLIFILPMASSGFIKKGGQVWSVISYLEGGQLSAELTGLQLVQDWCSFLPEDLVQFVHFLDVHLRGVDLAGGRPVHVPECPLLAVQDLPLLLVSLLGHLGLGLRLHEDELPLPGEHLLQSSQIFRFVVSQLESRLINEPGIMLSYVILGCYESSWVHTVLLYINKKLSFCQVLATESFILPSERGCEKFSKANFHTKKSPKRAKYHPKQSKVFLSLLFWPELMKNILIMPPSVHYRTTTTARVRESLILTLFCMVLLHR